MFSDRGPSFPEPQVFLLSLLYYVLRRPRDGATTSPTTETGVATTVTVTGGVGTTTIRETTVDRPGGRGGPCGDRTQVLSSSTL